MRTTTKWGFSVPNLDADPDEVPTHLGNFADQVDALVAKFTHGPYSSLPAAGHIDTFYYVDSGVTNLGGLYRDNGTTWDRINAAIDTTNSDITTAAFGDAPAAGSGALVALGNHRHGMMANPLTAHLAAADPHTQYRLESDLLTVSGVIASSSAAAGASPTYADLLTTPSLAVGTWLFTSTWESAVNQVTAKIVLGTATATFSGTNASVGAVSGPISFSTLVVVTVAGTIKYQATTTSTPGSAINGTQSGLAYSGYVGVKIL